jgi:hypothetical protein
MIFSNYSQTILIRKSTTLWVEIPCTRSLERDNVSEEHNASIFRVTEYVKQETSSRWSAQLGYIFTG